MSFSEEGFERHKFTADAVMRLAEQGFFDNGPRVELLEGDLVDVSPQGPIHSTLVAMLHALLGEAYGPGYFARSHSPVVGTLDSIPEPDVAIVMGGQREFMHKLPGPDYTLLVVEVAHSSLPYDRKKARVYAKAGYAMYWLIDVQACRLEVYTDPSESGAYGNTQIFREDETVSLPGSAAKVKVAALLP